MFPTKLFTFVTKHTMITPNLKSTIPCGVDSLSMRPLAERTLKIKYQIRLISPESSNM